MQPPRRVLVVEDERDVANLLGILLRRAGYEASLARDGQECLVRTPSKDRLRGLRLGVAGHVSEPSDTKR